MSIQRSVHKSTLVSLAIGTVLGKRICETKSTAGPEVKSASHFLLFQADNYLLFLLEGIM